MCIEKCEKCLNTPNTHANLASACLPVPAFGDLTSDILEAVTIGLNPALNEFVTGGLIIPDRTLRLPVLTDYNAQNRSTLNQADLEDTKERRDNYFKNEWRNWHTYFEKLELLLSRINPKWSYINGKVAHLDLVACATTIRWGDLLPACKSDMVNNCREHFLTSLMSIRNGTLLLLDGQTVMDWMNSPDIIHFEEITTERTIHMTAGQTMIGRLGKIRCQDKSFPFRTWPIPAGRLNPMWRWNIAFWVKWTLSKNL